MRKTWIIITAAALCSFCSGQSLADHPSEVKKIIIPFQDISKTIPCDFFQPDFLHGDSNYHSLSSASDGKLYFSIDTHNQDYACGFYSFDPATEEMKLIAHLDKPFGEDAQKGISQGKVHVPFFDYEGKLYFSTHISYYAGGLPGFHAEEKSQYKGGIFASYDMESGEFETLARIIPNEGLITMTMDKEHQMLYGLSWPSAIFVSFDLKRKELRSWGAVQNRGEWGEHPDEWDRVCRTLGLDPDGNVYGSTMGGRIWKFEPGKSPRPLSYIPGLDLSRATFSQSSEETEKGDFQHNWRVLEWNPATNSFFGVLWETTALFEFVPEKNYIRALADFRHEKYQGMPRNPEISQLGFIIAPDNNTILYLANGPATEFGGKKTMQAGLYLLSYDISRGEMKNHGLVLGKKGRVPFFTESLVIGADDHLYSVAWVEIIDPKRRETIAKAREYGPEETDKVVYEIQLIRLPKWKKFARDAK